MVPNPLDLYDDSVRSRTLWALREGFVIGGILLFWIAVAVAVSIVLFVVSLPAALFRFGPPGLPILGLVWTLVGPLAVVNASLYVLVRAGTVVVDHYQDADETAFDEFLAPERRDGRARASDEVETPSDAATETVGESGDTQT